MSQLGSTIQTAILSVDWSVRKLAEKSGLSPSAISAIEDGKNQISLRSMEKVAKAFGIKVEELFILDENLTELQNEVARLQLEMKEMVLKVVLL